MNPERFPASCALDGVLLIDKGQDLTSFQVVKQVKHLLQIKKVGHTGTLDPLATGLLPICLGRATKLASIIMSYRKEYDVWAEFGVATDSHDCTGQVIDKKPWDHLDEAKVRTGIESFVGDIQQVPPMFSAIKYKGRPLYWYAHKGIMLGNRKERSCTIYKFELLEWQPPLARFLVQSSQGTYVRTLIHDLGLKLGTVATVKALRRTACGSFNTAQALTLEALSAMDLPTRQKYLLSMTAALPDLPHFSIDALSQRRLQSGRLLSASELIPTDTQVGVPQLQHLRQEGGLFKLTGPEGRLVAIAAFVQHAQASMGQATNRIIQPIQIFSA